MGSFINWLKSGRLKPTIKGSVGASGMVPETVSLDLTTRIESKPTLGWVLAPDVRPNIVMISVKEVGNRMRN